MKQDQGILEVGPLAVVDRDSIHGQEDRAVPLACGRQGPTIETKTETVYRRLSTNWLSPPQG